MVEMSIYSIGSAQFLREVFNGLAMVTGTGDFVKAVMIGMLFSTIIVCFQGVLRGGREIAWQNILIGWILYGMFFAVPARVIIEDVRSGETFVVDNVPLGTAASGFIISRVGYGLTELLETGYGDAKRTTNLPYLSTLKYLIWAQTMSKNNSVINEVDKKTNIKIIPTLEEYTKNCVIPAVDLGALDKGETAGSVSISTLLAVGNKVPNTYSAIYPATGEASLDSVKRCPEVLDVITKQILPAITTENVSEIERGILSKYKAAGQMQGVPDEKIDQYNVSTLLAELNVHTQYQQEFMAASILRPVYQRAYASWNSRSGAIADLMVSQAMMQRNVQWTTEQELWASVVEPLMVFFEGFIYAITPFAALLLCMGSMGLGLIGRYLQVLFWINLWMPIMSICNLYIMMTVEGKINALNLASMDGAADLIPMLQNQIAVGGMLMTTTPMLALFVVTGSTYAFTTLAGRLNGGDHINEKMVAPDVVSMGAILNQADYMTSTRGGGLMKSGAQANFANLKLGGLISKMAQSAKQWAKGATESFTDTFMDDKAITTNIMNSDDFRQNFALELRKASEESSSSVKDKILSFLSSITGGGGLNLKLGWGKDKDGNVTKGFQIGGNVTKGMNDTDTASFSDIVKTAATNALAKSAAAGVGMVNDHGVRYNKGTSFQHAAQDYLNKQSQYSEMDAAAKSMGSSYDYGSNTLASTINQLQSNAKVNDAWNNAKSHLSSQDRDWISNKTAMFQQVTGNHDEAETAAILERLHANAENGDQQAMSDLCDVYSAAGMPGFTASPNALAGFKDSINPSRSNVPNGDFVNKERDRLLREKNQQEQEMKKEVGKNKIKTKKEIEAQNAQNQVKINPYHKGDLGGGAISPDGGVIDTGA